MKGLPSEIVDLQQGCKSARQLIGNNAVKYKDILRSCVPLPISSFVYELDTFSQIALYLNVAERDIFSYEDWANYLSDILTESGMVHMRSYSDRHRLESLISVVEEMKQLGESHPRFQRILRRREEMLNEFLASPYLLNTMVSYGVLDENGIKTAWAVRSVVGDVVFLETIIKCCIREIQSDGKIIPEVKQNLSSDKTMKAWKLLLQEGKFEELYEFVLNEVEKVAKH